ncbi:MAG: hypothetical protein LAT84_12975, partial [Balneolia bacterium]|nr:hypothetical protein [Balneolia bacterium]
YFITRQPVINHSLSFNHKNHSSEKMDADSTKFSAKYAKVKIMRLKVNSLLKAKRHHRFGFGSACLTRRSQAGSASG